MIECEVYINPNTELAQFRRFLGDSPTKVKVGEIIQFVEKSVYEKQLYGLAEIMGELLADKKSLNETLYNQKQSYQKLSERFKILNDAIESAVECDYGPTMFDILSNALEKIKE